MAWIVMTFCILMLTSGTHQNDAELDTGQAEHESYLQQERDDGPVKYRKIHETHGTVNQTEVFTRTIIKPVSYSYFTANVQPSKKTAGQVIEKYENPRIVQEVKPVTTVRTAEVGGSHASPNLAEETGVDQASTTRPEESRISYATTLRPVYIIKSKSPQPKKIIRILRPVIKIKTPKKYYDPKGRYSKKYRAVRPVQRHPEALRQVIQPNYPNEVKKYAASGHHDPRPVPPKQHRVGPVVQRPKEGPQRAYQKPQQDTRAVQKGDIDTHENRHRPVVQQKSVKFPLKTVLAGNSVEFDDRGYQELLPAVNSFSDVAGPRSPNEGLVVTHSAVSAPSPAGQSSRSHTTITNHGSPDHGNAPLRQYTASTHNTKGDDGDHFHKSEQYRENYGDGEPAASYSRFSGGSGGGGGGGGGAGGGGGGGHGAKHHESGGGSKHESDHSSKKGEKGEKGYKKKHKHDKSNKGHHDKEGHAGEYEEKDKHEKKSHEGDEYYGAQHKEEKGEKGSKYGEGGKHKKGHSTHGEHNIVKKNEYIKSTKFYDEDHGGGEHEEHGQYHGKHAEKKGGSKEGGHKKSNYHKQESGKKGHHDKGHDEEQHSGHESSEGHDDHYGHEEEYGSKKGGESSKKWGHSNGDKH